MKDKTRKILDDVVEGIVLGNLGRNYAERILSQEEEYERNRGNENYARSRTRDIGFKAALGFADAVGFGYIYIAPFLAARSSEDLGYLGATFVTASFVGLKAMANLWAKGHFDYNSQADE